MIYFKSRRIQKALQQPKYDHKPDASLRSEVLMSQAVGAWTVPKSRQALSAALPGCPGSKSPSVNGQSLFAQRKSLKQENAT